VTHIIFVAIIPLEILVRIEVRTLGRDFDDRSPSEFVDFLDRAAIPTIWALMVIR
jgi:hypothetical protein